MSVEQEQQTPPSQGVASAYIDGARRPSATGHTYQARNPANGRVIGTVSDCGPVDARQAVDAAAAALPQWAARTAYQRSDVLYRAYRLMLERADDLARLMTTEQGKPLRAARNEVGYAADFLIWYAEEAKRVYGSTIPAPRSDQRLLVLRQPVGVVAAITPWNYPISMIIRKVAPAIAAGCTIVLKPAEQTPLCAVEVFRILHEAGLPAGVANLLTTSDPAPVADVLLDDPRVRKLTFTGSTEVGKMLAGRAAATVKRVSLELGGHAPFIVFDDADPAHAAKGAALVKFLNTGQACICPNRIYVHRSILDTFLDVLVKRVRGMRIGDGMQEGVSIGPLIDAAALRKMEHQIADARAKGASVMVGGARSADEAHADGYFFAPTVLTGVTPSMDIYRQETFGPIAPVIPFDNEEEVVGLANDTEYGLASYVYTNDLGRAIRVAESLKFGIVGVNDINPTAAAAPFGGIKDSGLGREGGPAGIDEYLDTKLVGISVSG